MKTTTILYVFLTTISSVYGQCSVHYAQEFSSSFSAGVNETNLVFSGGEENAQPIANNSPQIEAFFFDSDPFEILLKSF